MAGEKKPRKEIVTKLDKIIAPLVAGELLDLIENGEGPISIKELVRRTQSRHSDVDELERQVPVTMYHRLLVISTVTAKLALPNITSFALNEARKEVGQGYPDSNPEEDREKARAFSWTPANRRKIIDAIEALPIGSPLT